MYNIMLVDDDPLVLVELKSMIEWDVLGCALLAEANSGRAAMEMLKECRPDIVFTDISMPNVSGVELINHIHETDGTIKVVALSAYEDFDYVRGSLKNGAKDYLLKHRISKESINELIKTLIREIREESVPKLPAPAEESKEDLLYRIVNEYSEIENPAALLARLKLSWLLDELLLAVGGIDAHFGEGTGSRTDELTMRFMIDETIKYYRDYFMMPLEPGLFLLVFSAKERSRSDIEEVMRQIQATLSRLCGLDLSFAVSGPFRGIETIKTQRQINKTILLEHYFQGNANFIVHQEGLEQPDVILHEDKFVQLNEMLYLKEPSIQAYFDELFEDLAARHLSREWVQVLFMELIMFLKRKIKTMQLDESLVFGNEQPYEAWLSFRTYEDIKAYLAQVCAAIQQELKKSFSKHSLSEKAMKYIEENYKEKVTLREIADALLVSPSYLSRAFKKSTGINVVAYINRVKMRHARELILQRKLSLQEIAYETGIQNYNYFYILFKETYGISPSDYIRSLDEAEK
ncbi:response regulator [Cohnella caldifontis]|uniref:response regulator n=1 Tax=Cohnella caldifontis TaxID=3027471 RepID=UPI0023EDEFAE|nr:response regulator [Cohnella sp. YIM B05605]